MAENYEMADRIHELEEHRRLEERLAACELEIVNLRRELEEHRAEPISVEYEDEAEHAHAEAAEAEPEREPERESDE